jgi:ABC-type uncharacterized transport system ATPase subunit
MRDAQVLILDEPTAVLTPQEIRGACSIIRSLAASGRSVLFITHKLKEVLAVADRITVMRLGKVVGKTTPKETNEAELATMMVGRSVELVVNKREANPGQPVLELDDLTRHRRARRDGGRPCIAHGARWRESSPWPACRATARLS